MFLPAFFFLIGFAFPASAATVVSTVSVTANTDLTTDVTSTFDLQGDLLLVYALHPDGNPITLDWNGEPLTVHTSVTTLGGTPYRLALWYLVEPDNGTHTLTMTRNGRVGMQVQVLNGTLGSDPFVDVEAGNTNNTVNSTNLTVTSETGAIAVDAYACNNPVTMTPAGSQTAIGSQVNLDWGGMKASKKDEGTLMSWQNVTQNCYQLLNVASVRDGPTGPDGSECTLDAAQAAFLIDGQQTISAEGSCQGFFPTSAWIGAVRIDPVGSHKAWSEGLGPFPDPYTLDTDDLPGQALSNGTWRIRMYGMDGTTLVVSDAIDVVLTGQTYGYLTDAGNPYDHTFSATDTILGIDGDGEGYVFSASTSAIVAAGGLRVDADGCAHVPGEDATSTLCTGGSAYNDLFQKFPLLSWPLGMFTAFRNAAEAVELAPTAYTVGLPSHGDWIPAVTLVDSASSGAGIGQYISTERQQFFRSILAFGLWVMFCTAMMRKAWRLLT